MRALAVAALALVAVAGAPVWARAQVPAREGGAESAKVSEAQRRFQRGIELYKDGDLGAALIEFKRAYELVPSYKVLYNLGQVSYQRHDYAAALRYFRQYLGEGDDAISGERQHEVAGTIGDLQQRVGRLELETTDEGAEVFVDDVLVGTTPLRALIAVNAGQRKLDVVARGGEHRTRVIDVAGGEVRRVSLPRLALQPTDPAPRRAAAIQIPSRNPELAVTSVASSPPRRSSFPWKSWTLTGLLAGGAAATGVVAWQSKRDLDGQLAMFPSDPDEVDYYNRKTRGFALATDGLLIGTAIMATISLYLTFREPR